MKNIKLMLIAAVLVLTAVACSNDDVDKGNSIFPTILDLITSTLTRTPILAIM